MSEASAPAVEPAAPEEPRRKLRGTHWVDWGKDTGGRLRVAGIYEGAEAEARLPVRLPETDRDDRADQELHEESARAMRDGDERKLGKLYEDLFDELHSSDFGEERDESAALLAYAELEGALLARLREESRVSGWRWRFRLTPVGLALRVYFPELTSALECRVLKPELAARIAQARTDARGAADELVALAREELRAARTRIMLGGEVPTETERAQA